MAEAVIESVNQRNTTNLAGAMRILDLYAGNNYDGMKLPFDDGEFDIVVPRYALHHFPLISDTFHETSRVLNPEGKLFISDPTPNSNDTERFVDAYMKMKKDGHIKKP